MDGSKIDRMTDTQNAAMLANACAMLLAETRGTADCYALAGPHNARKRVAIMATLLGVAKVPQAKAGVNALRDAFWTRCDVTGDCDAARDSALAERARMLAENATYAGWTQYRAGYAASLAERVARGWLTPYAARVRALELEGLTTSDAQAVADAEGLED